MNRLKPTCSWPGCEQPRHNRHDAYCRVHRAQAARQHRARQRAELLRLREQCGIPARGRVSR
jgi:hypothetical protein